MSDDRKPVDLVDARRVALSAEYAGRRESGKMMHAMADEIEELREGMRVLLRLHDREERDHDGAAAERIRALLPPS